jgi:uncharacterized protein
MAGMMASIPGDGTSSVVGEAGSAARIATSPLVIGAAVALIAITSLAGLRQGLLFAIGIGFGAVLAGVSFGFTTGWRAWIRDRDPTGFFAQFVAIGAAMTVSIPLIALRPELSGAIAPLSVSLVLGAFVFGAAMQVADGCGSGTLYKAGLGNMFSLAVLPGFIAGSFLGAAHLDRWLALGALPPVALADAFGPAGAVLLQSAAFAALAYWLWKKRGPRTDTRWAGRAIYAGAAVMAVLAIANLVVAGQPWGVVYGLGLWGAKIATWFGADLTANAYWGRDVQQAHIQATLLADVTSVTNLGLLAGALIAANVRSHACPPTRATAKQWTAALVAGLLLGYSARLAFGCNIGAYFSGISTGSVHGWIWFAAAFAGSIVGVRVRERLGLKA